MDPISFAAAFVHTQQNLKFFMLILTTYFKVREKFSYPQKIRKIKHIDNLEQTVSDKCKLVVFSQLLGTSHAEVVHI